MKEDLARNASILLVDDEPEILECLKDAIEDDFSFVQTANDGAAALQHLRHRHYDVVITDIRMPIMDGLELLRQTKGSFPQIPVMVVTGHGDRQTMEQAIGLGAFDYIEKPFSIDLLVNKARNAILQTVLFDIVRSAMSQVMTPDQLNDFFKAPTSKQIRMLASYASLLKLQKPKGAKAG